MHHEAWVGDGSGLEKSTRRSCGHRCAEPKKRRFCASYDSTRPAIGRYERGLRSRHEMTSWLRSGTWLSIDAPVSPMASGVRQRERSVITGLGRGRNAPGSVRQFPPLSLASHGHQGRCGFGARRIGSGTTPRRTNEECLAWWFREPRRTVPGRTFRSGAPSAPDEQASCCPCQVEIRRAATVSEFVAAATVAGSAVSSARCDHNRTSANAGRSSCE